MLELKSIEWQNFLSYGDYPTKLDLDNLGQCLITGEVIEEDCNSTHFRKSNGAGKSTIPNVIQWALFGRTMHSRAPGDNIINYFSGKDCWAKLIFKNGDMILRTRKAGGVNELLFMKDGDETQLTANTVSTTAIQQQRLNKAFSLDWETFSGSVFFNQYGKPWMEMAETTRKKAIERILHVDRLTYYAQAAKYKCDNLDKVVQDYNLQKSSIENNITTYQQDIERCRLASSQYESNKQKRIDSIEEAIEDINNSLKDLEVPDIDSLIRKWDIIKKVSDKLSEMQSQLMNLTTQISHLNGTIKGLEDKLKYWKEKSGRVCSTCEQKVETDHVACKIDPIKDDLKAAIASRSELIDKKSELVKSIEDTNTAIKKKTPDMTVAEARRVIALKDRLIDDIAKHQDNINNIKNETNPHLDSIAKYEAKISKAKEQLTQLSEQSERSEFLNKHYHYIYKSYNDRSKIKGYIFREHIPYINSRLQYYLEIFDLDIKIELTESLGIISNMWGYEYESGGERKRTDVAFMLAMFDFHEQIYGRQCNVLVMDEVDGRLDEDGIESLINIVKNDLSHRVESIIIISHRNLMFDTFSREIKVTRRGRSSHLEVI